MKNCMSGSIGEVFRAGCVAFTLLTAFSFAGPVDASFARGGGLGLGARAMGMGGAFVPVADDPDASYWNPAGIVRLPDVEMSGMYGSLYNDKTRNTCILVHVPTQEDIHLSIGISNHFYPEIDGPREDDYMVGAAIPLSKDRLFSMGVNVHYLYANLRVPGGVAKGMGVDLGLLYRKPLSNSREMRVGLAITDLSTTVRFKNGTEQVVPRIIEPGISYSFSPDTQVALTIPFAQETVVGDENQFRFRGGLEHWLFDHHLGFRTGYIGYSTLPGMITAGISFQGTHWDVDYAFMDHPKDLGSSHRIALGWKFGREAEYGDAKVRPYRLQALVGDGRIHLTWKPPEKVTPEGYWVYYRQRGAGEYQRARQELLTSEECLLRGARNGAQYQICVSVVVDGKESARSRELTVTPRPMTEEAKHYYDMGVQQFVEKRLPAALYAARTAETIDPNNHEIKDLLRKLHDAFKRGFAGDEESPR